MQVSVENGEGLERRMRVEFDTERIEAEVEKRLHELAPAANLRGFRPGKVPVKVLRRHFGEKVFQEAFADLMRQSFAEALLQEELEPAGMPEIEPDIDQAAKRYAYTAVFEVLPTFELGALNDKTVKRPVAEVTEADVEQMIEQLRDQRKTFDPVDRPAQAGDLLTVSFTGTIDGEAFEGGTGEDIHVELGSGRMLPGFEDGLVGARAGETRQLDLAFPDTYPAENLKGKAVNFDVHVTSVAEAKRPDLDVEFAKGFGVPDGDLERFHAEVRKNMERELKQRIEAKIKSEVMELLLETNQIEVPDALVKEQIEVLKGQARQLTGSSAKLELPDDLFRDQGRKRAALGLILSKVVSANGIEVDQRRVRESVENLAATYENPQQVIDHYYGNKDYMASMENLTLEGQVVDWVMEQVTVVDEPLTFREITESEAGT